MSRIYVCDRCKAQSDTWTTISVELPAPSFWGKKLVVELCEPCLQGARALLKSFMENI